MVVSKQTVTCFILCLAIANESWHEHDSADRVTGYLFREGGFATLYKALLVFFIVAMVVAASMCSAITTQEIVNQISATSFQNYLTNTLPTHIHDNRAFDMGTSNGVKVHGAQHDPARDNIFTAFRRSGWTTMIDPFTWHDDSGVDWSGQNVVAVKQGTTRPDDVYIIGAHYDSTANHESSWTYAPGGDDNGSGIAGILEIARVLSGYTFDATIVLAAFDGEEVTATCGGTAIHRLGSMHYAAEHATDNILGMISLDMMSWQDPSHPSLAQLETGYSQNGTINSAVTRSLQTYGGLTVNTRNSKNYSDHVSFADRGTPALMVIEGNWWNNPNYHRQTDSSDTTNYINYAYGTKMVKGVTGYLVDSVHVNGGLPPLPVPEPCGFALLGVGIAALGAFIRRRRFI